MPPHVRRWFVRHEKEFSEYLMDKFGVVQVSEATIKQAHSFFSYVGSMKAYHVTRTSGLLTGDGRHISQTDEQRARLSAQGLEAYHETRTSGLLTGDGLNIDQTDEQRARSSAQELEAYHMTGTSNLKSANGLHINQTKDGRARRTAKTKGSDCIGERPQGWLAYWH
ncbi:hypothetical protein THAOC_04734 [Thalassiosira oceanica]|uniref:Uncharacterized protein n=1 Tax=Thalassiosira oceanica TaxID=159749 RepID=K0TNL5_THAOC|nr:hypothetical protein THAOC_04734 [Thalassiosira oceanica]|eukprot:EJK73632.1 hypothetical protein THAOC_04734 [Thalassiosira oceanica]